MNNELNEKMMENVVGGASNAATCKKAVIDAKECLGCGCCEAVCEVCAISPAEGVAYAVDSKLCQGCGACERECPVNAITMV